jgi:hypothetical protein
MSLRAHKAPRPIVLQSFQQKLINVHDNFGFYTVLVPSNQNKYDPHLRSQQHQTLPNTLKYIILYTVPTYSNHLNTSLHCTCFLSIQAYTVVIFTALLYNCSYNNSLLLQSMGPSFHSISSIKRHNTCSCYQQQLTVILSFLHCY